MPGLEADSGFESEISDREALSQPNAHLFASRQP